MSNGKTKLKILGIGVLVAALLSYGAYFLLSEIESAKNRYLSATSEFISLEKKQEQIEQIKKELISTEQNRTEIISSLLSAGDILDFIVKTEDIAKKAGLVYEVKILRETTQESIDAEILALRQARRRGSSEEQEEAVKAKISGVVFSIDIEGSYTGIIRFLEGIASFPYYSHIESVSILKDTKARGAEGEAAEGPRILKANIQLMVFTKE